MKHTLSILLIIASTALVLTACEQKQNTMTKAEVGQWKMRHPFENLPKDTVIVDENGVAIKR